MARKKQERLVAQNGGKPTKRTAEHDSVKTETRSSKKPAETTKEKS